MKKEIGQQKGSGGGSSGRSDKFFNVFNVFNGLSYYAKKNLIII